MAEPQQRPTGTAYEQAVSLLNTYHQLPTAAALACDFILWPAATSEGIKPTELNMYPQVQQLLGALHYKGIRTCAVINKTALPVVQKAVDHFELHMLDKDLIPLLPENLDWTEALKELKAKTGAAAAATLVFYNSSLSAQSINRSGATGVFVLNGLTLASLEEGLQKYSQRSLHDRGF